MVDQTADKVCATMTHYQDKPSSREKDLVDVVIFATSQDIDGNALQMASTTETRRKMESFDHFTVPSEIGPVLNKPSKRVRYCADYPSGKLVARLIDPALFGKATGYVCSSLELAWGATQSAPKPLPATGSTAFLQVSMGHQVTTTTSDGRQARTRPVS